MASLMQTEQNKPMTPPEQRIVGILSDYRGRTALDLADITGWDEPYVRDALRALERRGAIERNGRPAIWRLR